MAHFAILNKDKHIKGILSIHVDDASIEDFHIEKDESDVIVEITTETFEKFQELSLTIKPPHDVLTYDQESDIVEVKTIIPVVPEEKLV